MSRLNFLPRIVVVMAAILLASMPLLGMTCGDDDGGGGGRGDDDDGDELDILQRGSTEICDPAGVRVVFSVFKDQRPIADLNADNFEVINDETGDPFQSEGGSSAFIQARGSFEFYSILVLDLSFSIVENDRLDDVLDGARAFVRAMIVDQPKESYKHNVAIYVFGSTAESELVEDFTKDAGDLFEAIEDLRNDPGRGSTNLYGAFIEGIDLLEEEGSGDMVVRSLVILTDGTHETGDESSMRRRALDKLDESDVVSYAIGIKGDYNEDRIKELASSEDYFFLVEDSSGVVDAFESVAELVEEWSNNNYVVGVCSPLEGPGRSLTIEVTYKENTGSLSVSYDATDFNLTGCDPEDVARGVGCGDDDDDDDECEDPGTWSQTGVLSEALSVDALLEASDGTIYAGTTPNGDVFRSTNGGNTWQEAGEITGATAVYALMESEDETIYAGTGPYGHVHKSINGGDTWTNTGELSGADSVLCLIQASNGALYAGTGSGGDVFKSTSGGDTWTATGEMTGATRVYALLEATSGVIYAGTGSGNGDVFKTTDGGTSWTTLGDLGGATTVWTLIQTYNAIYAGTSPNGEVFKTINNGSSWNNIYAFNAADHVRVLLESSDGDLFAGTGENATVFRSTNDGTTWADTGGPEGAEWVLSMIQASDGYVYAGTGNASGEVHKICY